MQRASLWLIAALLLGACSEDVPLPPVTPLSADPARVDALHGIAPGGLPVVARRHLILPGGEGERELRFNAWFPGHGKDFPLLLFSHGNWSDADAYDHLVEHWVSHGYVVLAPEHLDCCSMAQGIFNSLRYGQLGLIEGRTQDLGRLLDNLATIEELAGIPGGMIDHDRVAATGHSFGGWSAQQLGGAEVYDPDGETFLQRRDPRVQAVVAVSPPGPMFDTIVSESWKAQDTPTLATTGTWDIQPRFWPDWRLHLTSFETARPGEQFALVIEGADHYLGRLICRTEREAEPQWDALRMLQATSTSFLDAQLKQDGAAMELLHSDQLQAVTGGFASLSRR